MELSSLTLLLFTAFSSVRVISYVPQIRKVVQDTNGASAISYSTWIMWTGAHTATGLYAAINLADTYLACMSALYAGCCMIVIGVTILKRRISARARAQESVVAQSPRAYDDGLPQLV